MPRVLIGARGGPRPWQPSRAVPRAGVLPPGGGSSAGACGTLDAQVGATHRRFRILDDFLCPAGGVAVPQVAEGFLGLPRRLAAAQVAGGFLCPAGGLAAAQVAEGLLGLPRRLAAAQVAGGFLCPAGGLAAAQVAEGLLGLPRRLAAAQVAEGFLGLPRRLAAAQVAPGL